MIDRCDERQILELSQAGIPNTLVDTPEAEGFEDPEAGIVTGLTNLIQGQDYITVAFGQTLPADWKADSLEVENTVDVAPEHIFTTIFTARSTTGFTVKLNAAPITDNYKLRWRVTPY